jgi:aspartyl-tRNA(Asn)/glutamyl-tRNA(Gln) amidotransferase subunit A
MEYPFWLGAPNTFPAFKLGEKIDDPLEMYLSDIYTLTGSLADAVEG